MWPFRTFFVSLPSLKGSPRGDWSFGGVFVSTCQNPSVPWTDDSTFPGKPKPRKYVCCQKHVYHHGVFFFFLCSFSSKSSRFHYQFQGVPQFEKVTVSQPLILPVTSFRANPGIPQIVCSRKQHDYYFNFTCRFNNCSKYSVLLTPTDWRHFLLQMTRRH